MRTKKNEQIEWARREIELLKNEGDLDLNEELNNYANIALEGFSYLIKMMENVDRPGIAKSIFLQLLNGDPLTPIEDSKEDWIIVEGFGAVAGADNPGYTIYQCKRRPSLFKKVIYGKKNGEISEVKFSDTDRAQCIDINTNNVYTGGIGSVILDEILPIKMPYSPIGKIKIFTEEFMYYDDPNYKGDFDTVGVLYFRLTDGQMKEVKRFFKEDHETREMVEITSTEYFARKKKVDERKNKEDKKK